MSQAITFDIIWGQFLNARKFNPLKLHMHEVADKFTEFMFETGYLEQKDRYK